MTQMPMMFFGHGNPLNALADNEYSRAWNAIGRDIPRPRAIVSISAHWYEPGTRVTAMAEPRTIHDFGGFPRALFEMEYRAPGDPALAERIAKLLTPATVTEDHEWGLDHGTWTVLCHVFPKADIPVVQLSIDETQPPAFHYDLARRLTPLRDEGVLVMGSGNVVHNLHTYAWGRHPAEPFDWAIRFEQHVRACLRNGDDAPLVNYLSFGDDAMLSAPTPEHYLPLVYVAAMRRPGDAVTFPVEGIDGGSVSMLTVRIG